MNASHTAHAHENSGPENATAMGETSAAGASGSPLTINHASAEQIDAYDKYFKDNDERLLNGLKELVAIQSLAMAPEHAPDVLKAAEWVKKKLDDIGMHNATVHETDGYYTLTAEWMNAPGQPTALFYGHMDVQPVTPSLWNTDPWKAEIRDGKMYGRGATDDKGPVVALLSALEAVLTLDGKLPVNVMLRSTAARPGPSGWPSLR